MADSQEHNESMVFGYLRNVNSDSTLFIKLQLIRPLVAITLAVKYASAAARSRLIISYAAHRTDSCTFEHMVI